MADPRGPIENHEYYEDNEIINDALSQLYEYDDDIMPTRAPTADELRHIYESLLQIPLESGVFEDMDIFGLIGNIVLLDAQLDEIIDLDIPKEYDPSILLDLINYDKLYNVSFEGRRERVRDSVMFWASERLLPYFVDVFGREDVIDDRMTRDDKTYLHAYLGSAQYRIIHPVYVKKLLAYGFDLSAQDGDGRTPLHYMVLDSPDVNLSNHELRSDPTYVLKYKNYYRTLILLFRDPTANIDIADEEGITVRALLDMPEYHEAKEAYEVTIGNPSKLQAARKQVLTNKLPVPSEIGSMMRNMMGNTLTTARKAIKEKHASQRNNTRRKKSAMHNELLTSVPVTSGGGKQQKQRKQRMKSKKRKQRMQRMQSTQCK